ncbi:MAG: AzlD domain-containing protein [Nitriliruptoraceae bacterium]
MTVVALLLLAVGTYLMKFAGPAMASGRELPTRTRQVAHLLPAALLAALVASQTFGSGAGVVVDARVVGVAAAAIAVVLRAPFAVVVIVGAGVTALTRALFGWG